MTIDAATVDGMSTVQRMKIGAVLILVVVALTIPIGASIGILPALPQPVSDGLSWTTSAFFWVRLAFAAGAAIVIARSPDEN